MKNSNYFLNPWKLYLIWLLMFILFLFIGIPILSKNHSGGEQRPLTLLSYALNWFVYGVLTISFIIPFGYRYWFYKYWYFILSIALICIYLIFFIPN